MLGSQLIDVKRVAPGEYNAQGQWIQGEKTDFQITGAIQPLTDRDTQQLPEAWRSRARMKLYVPSGNVVLRTVDAQNQRSGDRVLWYDKGNDRTQEMLVVGFRDYDATPFGMVLTHHKYAMVEPEVDPNG